MTTQQRFKKTHSVASTRHMTFNHSHTTNFLECKETSPSTLLNYAHIAMPKETPNWNQSATTWRHSTRKYSFSKDSRFKENCSYYSDILKPQIPSTLTPRSCSFGKGNRKPISDVVLRNAKEKPGPDRYDMKLLDERPRQQSRGKTFGLGWKHYQRNFIMHRKDPYAQFHFQGNPPAKYQVRQKPGNSKQKYSTYGRLKMYTQKMADEKSWVPGPYHNVNDRNLYGTVGLSERNFGFGQRIDLSLPENENPEAIYQIEGFCDKFKNLKYMQQPVAKTSR